MKIFKTKKRIALALIICVVAFSFIRHFYNNGQAFYMVDYKKTDISDLIREKKITEKDYDIIYKNTGVSPKAAKELISKGDFDTLDKLNDLYFDEPQVNKDYIAYPVTVQERILRDATPLANLKKGDILVTFNIHTLDWRHGHCGIVLNPVYGTMLEHVSVGNKSSVGLAANWGRYPGFVILRYPDSTIAEKAADYAMENLADIEYSIFAGLIDKDKSDNMSVKSHCSHIVWQAYKAVGEDIDQNRGRIVTPKDIATSDKLEVVQIYGINPRHFSKRIMR